MKMTKKGLEADIAKLSRLINGGVTTSKQLIDKAGAYFEGETTLGELIDKSKPLLRKQKLLTLMYIQIHLMVHLL